MGNAVLTTVKACQLLGLNEPATGTRLSAAFRRAAKAAHPDSDGGNVERFRQVIDAYHLLQKQPSRLDTPAVSPPLKSPPPLISVTPLQALYGGTVSMRWQDRPLLVHVPPGIRTGDRLRLKDIGKVPVIIRPADGMSVLHGDIFTTCRVATRYLRDGGRIELDTPHGPQSAWLVPDMIEPVRLCFKGLGLPARGRRGAGDLFIKLEASDDLPSAAEDMLHRFNRVWTEEAAAA